MLRYPPLNSPLNVFFDPFDIIEPHAGGNGTRDSIPLVRVAVDQSSETFKGNDVKHVTRLAKRGNGDIVLLQIKRSGTYKELWNFGQ